MKPEVIEVVETLGLIAHNKHVAHPKKRRSKGVSYIISSLKKWLSIKERDITDQHFDYANSVMQKLRDAESSWLTDTVNIRPAMMKNMSIISAYLIANAVVSGEIESETGTERQWIVTFRKKINQRADIANLFMPSLYFSDGYDISEYIVYYFKQAKANAYYPKDFSVSKSFFIGKTKFRMRMESVEDGVDVYFRDKLVFKIRHNPLLWTEQDIKKLQKYLQTHQV